jgi:sporulation protein YtfJ
MADHPIQGLMKATMENLKQMVDVNTILGDPIQTPDGGVILTVSKVGFGFGAGGSDFNASTSASSKQEHNKPVTSYPFGGGSGGGVSISPVAFLVVNQQGIKIMHLKDGTHLLEKMMDLAPQTLDKIKNMMGSGAQAQQGQTMQAQQAQSTMQQGQSANQQAQSAQQSQSTAQQNQQNQSGQNQSTKPTNTDPFA